MLCFLSHLILCCWLVGSRVDIGSPARVLLSLAKEVQPKKKIEAKGSTLWPKLRFSHSHGSHGSSAKENSSCWRSFMLSCLCEHDHLPFVKYLSVGSPSEPRFMSISTPLPSQKSVARRRRRRRQDPCYAKFGVSLPIWLNCELAMIT
jgi:hypothetical protein